MPFLCFRVQHCKYSMFMSLLSKNEIILRVYISRVDLENIFVEKFAQSISLFSLVLSYGEPCLQDVQCSTTVPGAICESAKKKGREITTKSPDVEAKDKKTEKEKEKVCSCGQGNHYRFGRCFKKKRKTRDDSSLSPLLHKDGLD